MNRLMRVPLLGGVALLAGCGQNVNGPTPPIPPRAAELTIAAEKHSPPPFLGPGGHCGVRFDGSESCTYYLYIRVVVAEHAGGAAQLHSVDLEVRNRVTGRSETFQVAGIEPPRTGRVPSFGVLAVFGRAEYTFEVGEPWETRDLTVRGHLTDDAGVDHVLVAQLRNIR